MRRRRKKKNAGDDVALFPFLAVLICTMGALIVLLVVLVQQARQHAEELAAEKLADVQQQQETLVDQKRLQDERVAALESKRDATLDRLASGRLELSHLEEHITRLESRWRQLLQQAEQVNSVSERDVSDRLLAEEQVASIREEIAKRREEAEELKRRLAGRPKSYAIIPYAGASGTVRRPIFLECVDDAIIVQPEGVRLPLTDFSGPAGVGPGNPLDATLRTIREHLAAAVSGEPYPLLVVRPTGAHAYAAARAAMANWDDEFGYELVSADMNLKYPRADQNLAVKIAAAIRQARARQELLAAAMPGVSGRRTTSYIVKRRGGLQEVHASPASSRRPPSGGTEAVDQGRGDADPHLPKGSDSQAGAPQGTAAAAPTAIADQKGGGWGVPGANGDTQGFTRPIRVACLPDRLILLPQRGQYFVPKTTAYNGPMTHDDTLRFVAQVWEHMETWGIAAQGGYWIPVLSVEVDPRAEHQFARFQAYLAKSGIQVQRKSL